MSFIVIDVHLFGGILGSKECVLLQHTGKDGLERYSLSDQMKKRYVALTFLGNCIFGHPLPEEVNIPF